MSHDDSHACACGGNCGCQENSELDKVFLTREEYIARLEHYLTDLKTEIQSVEQELLELRQTA